MIHLIILMDSYSGLGIPIFDDGEVGIDSSIFSGLLITLSLFTKEISKGKAELSGINLGKYEILFYKIKNARYRGIEKFPIWALVMDATDNKKYAMEKLIKIAEITLTFAEEWITSTAIPELNKDLKNELNNILTTQLFPRDKLKEVDAILTNGTKAFFGMAISDVYLIDIDGGIVEKWESEKDEEMNNKIRSAFLDLVSTIPFDRNIWLEADIEADRIEGWKIERIGETEFCVAIRCFYGKRVRGLLQLFSDWFIKGIDGVISEYIYTHSPLDNVKI